jgi:hypothetical protein
MAQVLFATDTTPSLVDLDANFAELYSKAAWSTTGIGYATGAGGTVTQATSKSTTVTLNKICGQITMNAAALAAGATVGFQFNNSTIGAVDIVRVELHSGMAAGVSYTVNVGSSGAGGAGIFLTNRSAGSLSEAVVLSFIVFKNTTA